MEKNLYIDASHPNETRIVLKSNNSIEEYEYEDKNNLNFKNNIYLGTVSRVEPSLQAAFVNFGISRTSPSCKAISAPSSPLINLGRSIINRPITSVDNSAAIPSSISFELTLFHHHLNLHF